MVGAARFELTTSGPPDQRSNQAEPRPDMNCLPVPYHTGDDEQVGEQIAQHYH